MATTIGPATHRVHPTTTFISMSLDIHILVLQYLDPPDIVSLRKTCRTLLDATHQRIVWINALTKMCLENTVYLHSYPIADMSVPELEYAASTPERWNRYVRKHEGEKDFTPPPLTRTLQVPDDYWHPSNLAHFLTLPIIEQLYLVPGGRFLVTLSQSRIYVWDLGIVGITDPKPEPIAEIPSKGQWFSTHPSLDGEALRIIASDQYYGDDDHCFEVFEIFPWKPDAKFERIATLNVETQQGLDFTSVVGDLLILVCGSIIKLWNFATHGWVTWNTGNLSKQILATDKCIILLELNNLSVWDIPSLSYDLRDEFPTLEPDTITQPRTRIPYPVDFESLEPDGCAGLCDWYTGSPQPLWFDFVLDSSPTCQVFCRFKININDLNLPTIPLSSECSFRILQDSSMTLCPYRVYGDNIAILTWGTPGIAIHASSSPDDSRDLFFLSRSPAAESGPRQISFCPISGRLCCIDPTNIMITDYLPSSFKPST